MENKMENKMDETMKAKEILDYILTATQTKASKKGYAEMAKEIEFMLTTD
jgi:ribosomal protein L7Ae-like RNA K-turn-binding protein